VVDGRGSVGFRDLLASAGALAAELERRGVAGRRVALDAAPDRSWVIGFWSILIAGGTVVPLATEQPAPERRRLLAQARACALLAGESTPATREPDGPVPVWAHSDGKLLGDPPGLADAEAAAAGGDPEARTALLLFTSGTTGHPKGVPLSHRNVLSGIENLIEAWAMRDVDRLVHVLPLHHLHGICVAFGTTFLAGGTTELLPRFDPARVLEAAAKASVLMGVPTQHQRLVDYLGTCGDARLAELTGALSRLRLITSGSAKLPERLGEQLLRVSGQYPLERYGMTEVGIVLGNPLSGPRRPGCCGRPLPGCEIRIVGEAGEEVRPGEPGEIQIRGESVFGGYDGDERATAGAFERGFFKSGDTACWTEDGYVRILGRTSVDIIKSGGYKLSAIEIEEELLRHVLVAQVAVVGVPDDDWGERSVAVVVLRAGDRDADAARAEPVLRAFLKARLSHYKVPRRFVFWDDLPRNALGKVQKTILREQLLRAAP
jgi:malonyl-CoA/methylmalonyl-CoA synthetase